METETEHVLIPSVKELAKEAPNKVPDRYVRPNIDPPILCDTDSLPQIPVIDFNKLLAEEVKGPELEKLDLACKEWGFFQVVISTYLLIIFCLFLMTGVFFVLLLLSFYFYSH